VNRQTKRSEGIGSEVMTVDEVAEYLSCHHSTVYRLIGRGELPAFRVGSDFRFLRADLEEWIAHQSAGAPKGPEPKAAEAPAKRKPLHKPKSRA
jgi:excisionase family DNA binding protein